MDSEQLTEQETALYDRQIRVWGADGQRRLSKAHVLVAGMTGTIAEFCKNIVLAGVGSVTLIDDRPVTEESLNANFLIAPDDKYYPGRSIAEVCCDSLKDFNPMVKVSVVKGEVSSFSGDFYEKFDVVVVSCCSLKDKKLINQKCHRLCKRIAFYSVDCRDSCGEIFADLQNHVFTPTKPYNKTAEAPTNILERKDKDVELKPYLSYEASIGIPWKFLPKQTSCLYFAMRVIEKFEELKGCKPGDISLADLENVQKLRKELCEKESTKEARIPDRLLERLLSGRLESPPVCAILGGILGQEVIKAISGKGEPLRNFFYFDVMDGKGIIQDICRPDPVMEEYIRRNPNHTCDGCDKY